MPGKALVGKALVGGSRIGTAWARRRPDQAPSDQIPADQIHSSYRRLAYLDESGRRFFVGGRPQFRLSHFLAIVLISFPLTTAASSDLQPSLEGFGLLRLQ